MVLNIVTYRTVRSNLWCRPRPLRQNFVLGKQAHHWQSHQSYHHIQSCECAELNSTVDSIETISATEQTFFVQRLSGNPRHIGHLCSVRVCLLLGDRRDTRAAVHWHRVQNCDVGAKQKRQCINVHAVQFRTGHLHRPRIGNYDSHVRHTRCPASVDEWGDYTCRSQLLEVPSGDFHR